MLPRTACSATFLSHQWVGHTFPGFVASTVRFFAKKRKRLDQYDNHEAPLRRKYWMQMQEKGGFFAYSFAEMQPAEIVETVHVAVKMDITSNAFWERAALTVGDIAAALSPKQLATVCHAFGAAEWRDEKLVNALAPALVSNAGGMRPSDIAVAIQSFARSSIVNRTVLQTLAHAAEVNERMAPKGFVMIVEAFARMSFHTSGFESRLQTWAESGGLNRCSELQTTALAHSLSLLPAAAGPECRAQLVAAFGERLAGLTDALEPHNLHVALLALAKLRCEDVAVLTTFERAMHQELHRMHITSLPGVLDAFAQLCEDCGAGQSLLEEADAPNRRAFIARLTGKITRQLRHLRPQDAARALQAVERMGVLDPYLLRGAAELVPNQLAQRPPAEILSLLENYAAARNVDGFMLPCIRQALLPPAPPGAVGGPLKAFALAQLDDIAVARAAAAFASLGHVDGILGLLVALDWPSGGGEARRLSPSCELVVAAIAEVALPSAEAWAGAAAAAGATMVDPALAELWAEATGLEVRARWLERADAKIADADALLLAVCAFTTFPQHAAWVDVLTVRLDAGECSIELLPGLLLKAGPQAAKAAEVALVARLARGAGRTLPAAAAVAATRGLALRAAQRSARDAAALRPAVEALAGRVAELVQAREVRVKSVVRILQALQRLRQPPAASLVRSFAETGDELSAAEFLVALRLLSARDVEESRSADKLGALATRVMVRLHSSRQAWELEGLCKSLRLDLGEVEAPVGGEALDEGGQTERTGQPQK